MSKMCQSNGLNTMYIDIYTNTHTYIVFHKKMGAIVFKRIIEKDLLGRCQYRNIKNCGVVDISYKDWKDGGKTWLMVRWFLIFHGKTGFEISPQNLWGTNNVQNLLIKKTKHGGDNQYIYMMGVIISKGLLKRTQQILGYQQILN